MNSTLKNVNMTTQRHTFTVDFAGVQLVWY